MMGWDLEQHLGVEFDISAYPKELQDKWEAARKKWRVTMADDVFDIAAKQMNGLLRAYSDCHNQLMQAIGLLQGVASGEIDPKRLKSMPSGVQLMPEQPAVPSKPSSNGKKEAAVQAAESVVKELQEEKK